MYRFEHGWKSVEENGEDCGTGDKLRSIDYTNITNICKKMYKTNKLWNRNNSVDPKCPEDLKVETFKFKAPTKQGNNLYNLEDLIIETNTSTQSSEKNIIIKWRQNQELDELWDINHPSNKG